MRALKIVYDEVTSGGNDISEFNISISEDNAERKRCAHDLFIVAFMGKTLTRKKRARYRESRSRLSNLIYI